MAKVIQTPFGELDLETNKAKIKLKDTPYNTQLIVEWEGIQYLEFRNKHAQLVWKVSHADEQGKIINDPSLATKILYSEVNNNNLVTADGVMITQERFPAVTLEDGTQDNSAYEQALANGFPEFDFWLGALDKLPLTKITEQAIPLLIASGKFDI